MGIMYTMRAGYGFQLGLKEQSLVAPEAWQKFLDEAEAANVGEQPALPIFESKGATEYLWELFASLKYFDYIEQYTYDGNIFVVFFKGHYIEQSFAGGGDYKEGLLLLESPGAMEDLSDEIKVEIEQLSDWFHVYSDEPEVITLVDAG